MVFSGDSRSGRNPFSSLTNSCGIGRRFSFLNAEIPMVKLLLDELTRQVVIVNDLGLHARAAAKVAKLAQDAQSNVWISRGDTPADASSVIDILSLECPKGTTVSISVEDPSDLDILEAIDQLIREGFKE